VDTERRIREALAAGDVSAAAEALVQGYGPGIHRYLQAHLEPDDAHDVFAQCCEDLLRGLPSFRGESSARTWAYKLARHALCRHLRDPYRARGEPLPTSAASRLAMSVVSSSLGPGSRRDRLRLLREQLPEEDRTLLALRVDRELEWQEVAEVLSSDGPPVTSAALRKRYERLVLRIEQLARELRLLDTGSGDGVEPRRGPDHGSE
jgi:RNA polymerase sigma-70 factor (ECF subfamily)